MIPRATAYETDIEVLRNRVNYLRVDNERLRADVAKWQALAEANAALAEACQRRHAREDRLIGCLQPADPVTPNTPYCGQVVSDKIG